MKLDTQCRLVKVRHCEFYEAISLLIVFNVLKIAALRSQRRSLFLTKRHWLDTSK